MSAGLSRHGIGRGPRIAAPFRRSWPLTIAVVALAVAACGDDEPEQASAPTPPQPTLVTERSEPPPAAARRLPRPPAPGSVRLAPGPFSDRVAVEAARFEGGSRPVVRGKLRNTVDVSHVISLELRADFYDRDGRPVASGRQTFAEAEEFARHPLAFALRARRPAPDAVAAVISIPDLVNE